MQSSRQPFSRAAVQAVSLLAAMLVAGCATPAATTPPPSPAPAVARSKGTTPPVAVAAPAQAIVAPPHAAPEPPQAVVAPPTQEQAFAAWVQDFRAHARGAGIDTATLQDAFALVQYLPQVVERDRSQAEFTRSVWEYLDVAVSPSRIVRGQERLYEVRAEAEAAASRYGVPATILVAIWGMESNYGSNYGSLSVIDALATLGFDGRREAWARGQLLAALRILQSGDIARDRMIGSWAGAMGQTQFLPSNFLAYAVDADGDGRRDIWGSMADVLASTANFLARSGWRAGQPWGLEVRLPDGFDFARADTDIRQSSARWAAEGVRAAAGTPLPEMPDAALFLPAGARGPAFLVGHNFRTILRYNNATSYALAVGLLAQQLAGEPGVQAPWPRDLQALTREQVLTLQTALNRRGFDAGTPDGLMGPATRAGVRRFQRSIGWPADGYPTQELLERLAATP
ncbi:lytic murein transglycosylase [Comamonadaceae bacterium G21597-S1]|nr:lytic murein transglycosylase [Comamonadaceae bacterium G21597-S1]